MKDILTAATRPGRLAVAQTEIVIAAIKRIYPDIKIEIKKVTTAGDTDRRTALWSLKTSGFFTSRVEDVLLAGEADFAVHSFKDLPTGQREGLSIAAVCERGFVEDCVITAEPADSMTALKRCAKIGTSSPRRAAQIRHLRKDVEIEAVRGNVQRRLSLVAAGKVDAVILARAGMERLGLGENISFSFDPAQFIPAAAQGALAVQTRADNDEVRKLLAAIDEPKTRAATFAERQILVTTKCGCHGPVGAFAQVSGSQINIRAFVSDLEGENLIVKTITGAVSEAPEQAEKLAIELLEAGGGEILKKLTKRYEN